MRKMLAGFGIGLGAAALVLGLDFAPVLVGGPTARSPLETLELKTYDWRLARTADPSHARRDIALVEIDEYSLRNLEPNAGRWPWPRAFHSFLLDFLARASPKVVVYDVNFAEPDTRSQFTFAGRTWTGEQSDRALANAVARAGNIVLVVDATYEGDANRQMDRRVPDLGFRIDSPLLAERRIAFPPFGLLADATTAFGHSLVVLDADGPLRHSVPFVRVGGQVLPSLGLEAAMRAEGIPPDAAAIRDGRLEIGGRQIPLSIRSVRDAAGVKQFYRAPIGFRGPALLPDLKHRPYDTYSFFDLLYSEQQLLAGEKPEVDPSVFDGRIVFVGVTASGLRDVFETPFAGGQMPGIQVHAAVADDFLSGHFLEPPRPWVRIGSVLAFAVVVGLLAASVPAWWASAGTALLAAAFLWMAVRLFAAGHWINLSQPLLSGALALFGGVAYQYGVEGRERRRMRRLFGQYVSPDVCAQLVANPALARLGGQRREMTVLFSDIRGFTSVTERDQPEEIVGMLNEYFTCMVDIVFRHQGTLDKFVGDMVMALFGAPLDDPQHAEHAVRAALEMTEALEALNARWAAEGRHAPLDIGIGINSGPMIAGNIGSEAIMSYTVIGDAVNLGARLESLTKQYGTRIIISEATRRRLIGRYSMRSLGNVVVKGKTEPVAIFEVGAVPEVPV